ncbi:chloride channel protein [Sedimenticola sp.]|uniref:chloride channel protein n=1 Tax=Sedimenticola sp. TaxID=1940285 RepID=UPI002587D8C7|nr:chloride channel protein [Sedimenticola sp.]MCW8904605.1 chloride channel protein [Sedimenticola sp.]
MRKNNLKQRIHLWSGDQLEQLRLHLSRHDALLQLSLLGLLTGLLAGTVIVLFRLVVEQTQAGFLADGLPENYEALSPWLRFLLPIAGALIIALFFHLYAKGETVLGVTYVMERMAYHQGYLTFRGFVLQFVGAAVAIISGHSVGREGPHILLGAAAGSLLGQRLFLPNNSIRTLVGCGTAAGIAASFNTPLAGVIFALEVVMMEYSLVSFIPVILAAVTATGISIAAFGNAPAFEIPPMTLPSLAEIPVVLLLGLLVGGLSALFIQLMQMTMARVTRVAFWRRVLAAGVLMGVVGFLVPQAMGIGYDTVNSALLGELGITLLMIILVAKVLATVACLGLGVPGGNIGPLLFLGGCLGSLTGQIATHVFHHETLDVGFYALLGMGAMMGATLQAPLAALTAMMELTHSPQTIMPGMLVIVVAGLTVSELFRKESLFLTLMRAIGKDYDTNPVMLALRRAGVASVMHKRFVRPDRRISRDKAEALLRDQPEWLLIQGDERPVGLMPAVDLVRFLKTEEGVTVSQIDLLAIPGQRVDVAPIYLQATLQEALERLDRGAEALYVERMTAPGIRRIYGVLTREQVESAYKL